MQENGKDKNREQEIFEEERLLSIERELELSMTEEINRILEDKSKQGSAPAGVIPPVPDFRPSLQKKAPAKKSGAFRKTLSYACIILLLLAAVAVAFFLLFELYKEQISDLSTPKDSSAFEALSSGGKDQNGSGASDPDSGSIPSEMPSGTDIPSHESSDIFPSGGYSSKDAALSHPPVTREIRNDEERLLFTVIMENPVLSYPTNPAAEKVINAYIKERMSFYESEAEKELAGYAANLPEGAAAGRYELHCSLLAAKNEILTLTFTVLSHTGGASALTTVECCNFHGGTGALLTLEEAVSDTARLAELSVSHIDKSLVWEEIYEEVIAETVCDTWYPSAEGIVLVYQKYSIGPGASGTVEVLVPYAELTGILCAELAES